MTVPEILFRSFTRYAKDRKSINAQGHVVWLQWPPEDRKAFEYSNLQLWNQIFRQFSQKSLVFARQLTSNTRLFNQPWPLLLGQA